MFLYYIIISPVKANLTYTKSKHNLHSNQTNFISIINKKVSLFDL